MKKLQFLTLLIACISIPRFLFAEQVERTLNLEDSITTGLHNSQELLSLQEQVSIARERVTEAGAQIYPKIDFNLSFSKFDNQTPTVLAPSFNSIYLPASQSDSFYATRVSLWQYLYASGRYTTNLRLAETNLSQAKSQADAARNKVILDVRNSYYACLTVREKIKAHEKAISSIKRMIENNPAAKSRWSYQLSSVNFEALKLRHEYEKQKLQYLKAIGIELNTVVEITGDLVAPAEEYELNKCLAWAFNYRPELSQTQFQETIDGLRVRLSLAERYPTVTLGANYEHMGNSVPMDGTNWNATININLPLFDGWASWSRIRQQKFLAREGQIRRAQIQDQVRGEVMGAFLDYSFWKERINEMNSDNTQFTEPDKKLEAELVRLETLQQSLTSQATLEWSIGKIFFK
jgi:outer membrane protein TolC